ncbi:hypothetical protein JD844_025495 [Phrynosoma platyrhinos]|uniref:Uncharacterized protein n=1 Tax=Phrynosoma platyrhinos TaxID=52577 RepID=A0ABQ7SZC8_PHRPL|nr:hypothetical protein JD844_025495 [Phrynosoma platyrhinos]
MVSGLQYSLFLFFCLTSCQESPASQSCMNKQQLLATIRQMQQFLKGQETRFVEGIRLMKHRLTTLQNTVIKAAPEPKTGRVDCIPKKYSQHVPPLDDQPRWTRIERASRLPYFSKEFVHVIGTHRLKLIQ